MELVKLVDVHVDASGKLIFSENPNGNSVIRRGKVTKFDFPNVLSFCKFFINGCPKDFVVNEYVIDKNNAIVYLFLFGKPEIKITFEIKINDKGIFGYYTLKNDNNRWKQGEYQIFFYHWDAEINSMKLFQNVFDKINFFGEDEQPIKFLKQLYPDASSVYAEKLSRYDWDHTYFVKYGGNDNERTFAFSYDKSNKTFKLLGYAYGNDYGTQIRSVDDLRGRIDHALQAIEDITAVQEIMDLKIMDLKKNEGRPYEQAAIREKTKEEFEKLDKIRRKNEAEKMRTLPRNPVLMNWSTHNLLDYLDQIRKRNYDSYYHVYSFDEIKAELSHRPHVPSGPDGKIHRRNMAQGKTELSKPNSRTSKKNNGK